MADSKNVKLKKLGELKNIFKNDEDDMDEILKPVRAAVTDDKPAIDEDYDIPTAYIGRSYENVFQRKNNKSSP
jgi:hypothetical protein